MIPMWQENSEVLEVREVGEAEGALQAMMGL